MDTIAVMDYNCDDLHFFIDIFHKIYLISNIILEHRT